MAFPMFCFLVILLGLANEVHGQSNVFNVKDFGAVSDGKTDNSKALLSAWSKACEQKGKGIVLIPSGTFMVSPLTLKGPCIDDTVFNLYGVLKAPNGPSLDFDHWINFGDINGLIINGNGSIDGQGSSAWEYATCTRTKHCKLLPVSLKFNNVTNASIEGITSLNSKSFHMSFFRGENIIITNLNLRAPEDSPNTDGIHVSNSNNITIADSAIATGDDCVSLGQGSTNVHVSGVSCGPGHGISIGSLGKYPNEEGVSGITVTNCNFSGTENGVRIKTWAHSTPSKVYNVTFEDISMDNVWNPIIIDQHYCSTKNCQNQGDSLVQISNVKFKSVIGTSRSKVAVALQCSRKFPCQAIELNEINLNYSGPDGEEISVCSNVKGISSGQLIPPPCF